MSRRRRARAFVVNAKVEIRVHVKPAGGAWSNWTGAATSQCQT
ncbi:hypothetical protein AB0C13_19610 [Streptomyces sp. NPDC049099]